MKTIRWNNETMEGIATGCIEEGGIRMTAYCNCTAKKASELFETPDSFIRTLTEDDAQLSTKEIIARARLEKACTPYLP